MKRRTLPVNAEQSLELFLAKALGLSSDEVRRLVGHGAVYVGGRRCSQPERKVGPGQVVTAVLEEGGQSTLTEPSPAAPLMILHEDETLLAVDKPSGVYSQPTPGRTGHSLMDQVGAYLGRPAGLVHRLDRETSGVTVFGKSHPATQALQAAFRERHVQKRYLAVTGPGLPASGSIELPISKDPSRPGRYRASPHAHDKPAYTEFERLGEGEGFCLASLRPLTGRTHQLRAHLAALGVPILGDRLYGGKTEAGGVVASRCLLHAESLTLPHPTSGQVLTLRAPSSPDKG